MSLTSTHEVRVSEVLSKFLNSENNQNLEIKKFNEYLDTIDYDSLAAKVPKIKKYTPSEKLKFMEYHFGENTKDFTTENLTFDKDFTNYLTENYLNANQLNDLLIVKPLTSREVGNLPDGWIDKKLANKTNEIKSEIYDAIKIFQEERNVQNFENNLSRILNKKVEVDNLGHGVFGTGYKISMKGAKDTCIKIFSKTFNKDEIKNVHGQQIEVQTGLFANKHSNDFVKMYFGKVASNKNQDGFLVTQYLSDKITPEENMNIEEGYIIKSGDAWGKHNIINGKIIDFGGVKVINENTK